jgi:predicted Zn-dependent peptidase
MEHHWSHPRDLQFGANRFAPPDPKSSLVVTRVGLRAFVIPVVNEHVVQVTAALPLGRSVEQANEAGAAEVLSRLLSQQVNERLGSGFVGRVQLEQDVDVTRFSVQTLADDWREGLSALVDAVRQPRLDPATIDAFRTGPGFARQTRGLGGASFRPAVELARMVGAYPLAPPEAGLSVRREAVRSLASRSLRPDTVVFGVGGGLSRENVQRELESLTAGWQATAAPSVAPTAAVSKKTSDRVLTIDEPGFTTWIAIGHPVPRIDAADEAAVAVMTDILNIRLNIAVREIRGLANQMTLQMPATPQHEGLLHVRSGARPESIAPLIFFAQEELSRIREAGGSPTADELDEVKGGLVLGKWQGSLDGAEDASSTYATETVRRGSLDRLFKWPDAVRAVTARQVTAAAQAYVHPELLGTVIIGQLEAVRKARHPRWPMVLDEVVSWSPGQKSNP